MFSYLDSCASSLENFSVYRRRKKVNENRCVIWHVLLFDNRTYLLIYCGIFLKKWRLDNPFEFKLKSQTRNFYHFKINSFFIRGIKKKLLHRTQGDAWLLRVHAMGKFLFSFEQAKKIGFQLSIWEKWYWPSLTCYWDSGWEVWLKPRSKPQPRHSNIPMGQN